LGDYIQTILGEDYETSLQTKKVLNGRRILRLGFYKVLVCIFYTDTAGLCVALRPIVQKNGAVFVDRNLCRSKKNVWWR
jgi:hypothetical protein